jgi:undecaprenyl-diphosphatase
MSLMRALILGILQGATEFLPVSSSGHLVLVPWLLGWPDPGLAFDTMVHWGTAFAVLGYFWRDWLNLLQSSWQVVRTRSLEPPGARLVVLLILGTLPAAVAGYLLEDFFESMFARPAAAAGFLLVTAGFLAVSERLTHRCRELEELGKRDALTVGTAQALAIFPGISRSGATIAAGMGRGLTRAAAARFSFLLATPIILGAGTFKLLDLAQAGELAAQTPSLVVGFLFALLVGLACIHFLLRYLQRHSLYPFAIYCSVVGIGSLLIALLGA